jgi:hypothetical protein
MTWYSTEGVKSGEPCRSRARERVCIGVTSGYSQTLGGYTTSGQKSISHIYKRPTSYVAHRCERRSVKGWVGILAFGVPASLPRQLSARRSNGRARDDVSDVQKTARGPAKRACTHGRLTGGLIPLYVLRLGLEALIATRLIRALDILGYTLLYWGQRIVP